MLHQSLSLESEILAFTSFIPKETREVFTEVEHKKEVLRWKVKHDYVQPSKSRCHVKPEHNIIHLNHSW